VNCLSTRATTATATSGVTIALAANSSGRGQQQMAADTGLLGITQLYELPNIHTHTQNIEHAKFSPTCPYIRYVKGHAFIREHHREYRTELD